MSVGVISGRLTGKSPPVLAARIRGANGSLITQASLSSITYRVWNVTLQESVATGTLTISSVVFDELKQTDPRWRQDGPYNPGPDGAYGYNFLAILPAATFDDLFQTDEDRFFIADKHTHEYRVRIDIQFTPTSGQGFVVPFEFAVDPTWV